MARRHGILLVGPNERILSEVTEELVGVETERQYNEVVEPLETGCSRALYRADNKYYTADIPVGWCLELSHVSPGDEAGYAWPALVFVIDTHTQSFFDDMVLWWEASRAERTIPDIPLVVAWGLCPCGHRVFLDRVLDWCIDHGFELIEIYDTNEEGDTRDSGMTRLEDALQAHAWPHASMKKPVHQSLSGVSNDVEDGDTLEKEVVDHGSIREESDPDQLMFEKVMAMSQEFQSLGRSGQTEAKRKQMMMEFLHLVSPDTDLEYDSSDSSAE